MIIKTIIIAVILVAIVMLTFGIKMLFDKNAKFEVHSCGYLSDNAEGTCYKCQIRNPNPEDCPEVQQKIKTHK